MIARCCIVAVLILCAACAAPKPEPAREQVTSAQQMRDDKALLIRLEHDLADLVATREVELAHPPFDATEGSIKADLARVDREMRKDTAIRFPANLRDQRMQSIGAYRNALEARNARAIQLAQMQADERESSTAYSFERSHNRALLDLHLRLQTLHLDATSRRSLARQLAALQRQQAAAVAAQRSLDDAQLASLRASLSAQTAEALQRAQRDLHTHADVIFAAQEHPAPNLSASIAATDGVNADLAARLDELRAMHEANIASLNSEIGALQAECDRLQAEVSKSSRDPGAASASSPAP